MKKQRRIKTKRVRESIILRNGTKCEVDYAVVKKKSKYRPPYNNFGTLDENWNEDLQDWNP